MLLHFQARAGRGVAVIFLSEIFQGNMFSMNSREIFSSPSCMLASGE
jgi:hypothetical protein